MFTEAQIYNKLSLNYEIIFTNLIFLISEVWICFLNKKCKCFIRSSEDNSHIQNMMEAKYSMKL